MKTFRDSENREWVVSINVDAIRRVKGLLGVNLAGYMDKGEGGVPLSTRLQYDVILFCDVLFALCKPEAERKQVSDEDFGRGLGGEAIFAARAAFFEEWADFFRQLRQTDAVTMLQKQAALVEAQVRAVTREVEAIDPEALMAEALKTSAGTSQASSA